MLSCVSPLSCLQVLTRSDQLTLKKRKAEEDGDAVSKRKRGRGKAKAKAKAKPGPKPKAKAAAKTKPRAKATASKPSAEKEAKIEKPPRKGRKGCKHSKDDCAEPDKLNDLRALGNDNDNLAESMSEGNDGMEKSRGVKTRNGAFKKRRARGAVKACNKNRGSKKPDCPVSEPVAEPMEMPAEPEPMEDLADNEGNDDWQLPYTFAGRYCPKKTRSVGWYVWRGIVKAFMKVISPKLQDRSRAKREAIC